eukprot:418180_1
MASHSAKLLYFVGGFVLCYQYNQYGAPIRNKIVDMTSKIGRDMKHSLGKCGENECIDVDMPCSNAWRISNDVKKVFKIALLENSQNGSNYVIHSNDNDVLNSKIELAADEIIMNEQIYVKHDKQHDINVLMEFLITKRYEEFDSYKGKWKLIDIGDDKCRICSEGRYGIANRWMRQRHTYKDKHVKRSVTSTRPLMHRSYR